MLKKTPGSTDMDASRILVKGPEFLRRQMERESEANRGRVSAVERLAATKPQYVKSQQVVGSSQEPVISIGSASVSSHGTSSVRGSVNNTANVDVEDVQLPEEECDKTSAIPEARSGECATRKDSEATQVTLPILNGHSGEIKVVPRGPLHRKVAETQEQERRSRRGVSRSSSDISSRYSKNFANFDAFFKYCGLEGDVIESLGRENFSARSDDLSSKIRSISVSTSDDGASRSSDGLHEEELQETVRQGSSVVERNARIIKWLYSCRNAAESGKTLRDLD
ncbi:hypothetical protein Q8A67_016213 [Cirrhinus molitorella]|uniref:Family with sequence similarity 110 member C n=1 Tax=Cirrhinus molitorella TaxID=172907 RepID=A0AA88THS3_9TELE|nr:hypothetical protein Q8A67_016213 [Cirrhinus molitorella]